jgi:hypothetical protein
MARFAALGLAALVAAGCVAGPGGSGAATLTGSVPQVSPAVAEQSVAVQTATPPAPADGWSPPPMPTVAGRDVYTVSRATAVRDAGALGSRTIALGGYWSASGAAWSCPAPDHQPADLELYCRDGAFGITERYESILVMVSNGNMTTSQGAAGPHLSPWVPAGLQPLLLGQTTPAPVPIVVLGHFRDARAGECGAEVRQACLDRFVIESILVYDPASAPAATPSPSPTPFPSPAPSGLFPAAQCAGDVPYSFAGWTTTDTLHSTLTYEGHVWAAVTRDVVPTGQWNELPDSPGRFNLPMGRRVCVGLEVEAGGMSLGVVLGTAYRLWDDGQRTTADDFGPGSGDPSLPAATSFPPLPQPVRVEMHGQGLPDAAMTVRDWSGLLAAARPATDAELAIAGAETGPDQGGATAVLPSDPRAALIVWAECGSDATGTIVVTKDRQTVLLQAEARTDCGEPGARRGAVLTFTSAVPPAIQTIAGLPLP